MPISGDFLRNEEILNTRGDQVFYIGAKNNKIESAEKSTETGGHQSYVSLDSTNNQTLETSSHSRNSSSSSLASLFSSEEWDVTNAPPVTGK